MTPLLNFYLGVRKHITHIFSKVGISNDATQRVFPYCSGKDANK
jgi:hypothetical protein